MANHVTCGQYSQTLATFLECFGGEGSAFSGGVRAVSRNRVWVALPQSAGVTRLSSVFPLLRIRPVPRVTERTHEREDSLWGWGPGTFKYHVLHCVQVTAAGNFVRKSLFELQDGARVVLHTPG